MRYEVGDKVRIIKPLYSDNPRLDEVMEIILLRPNGNYVLEDDQDEWHYVQKHEIELIQGFRTSIEIEEINKKRSFKNNVGYEELVDHPEHYNKGSIEVIDVIEDWELGFNLGNVLKYVGRAEAKGDKIVNLEKALWYLKREINKED